MLNNNHNLPTINIFNSKEIYDISKNLLNFNDKSLLQRRDGIKKLIINKNIKDLKLTNLNMKINNILNVFSFFGNQ